MIRTLLLSSTLVVGLAALPASCKKKDEGEKADDTAAETTEDGDQAEAVDEPEGGHGSGTGGGSGGGGTSMVNKMMHCPSAVEGSTTKVESTDKAVTVTVTAEGAENVAEIQKRADYLAGLSAEGGEEIKHTGQGTGGGALGKCPVVMKDVTVTAEKADKGSVVTLTPKDAAGLDDLAKTAQSRADELAQSGVPGSGEGEGDSAGDEATEDGAE